MAGLTTATFERLHIWLVETPLLRPWCGSIVPSARSIQSRMKDLRAVLA